MASYYEYYEYLLYGYVILYRPRTARKRGSRMVGVLHVDVRQAT